MQIYLVIVSVGGEVNLDGCEIVFMSSALDRNEGNSLLCFFFSFLDPAVPTEPASICPGQFVGLSRPF